MGNYWSNMFTQGSINSTLLSSFQADGHTMKPLILSLSRPFRAQSDHTFWHRATPYVDGYRPFRAVIRNKRRSREICQHRAKPCGKAATFQKPWKGEILRCKRAEFEFNKVELKILTRFWITWIKASVFSVFFKFFHCFFDFLKIAFFVRVV